MIILGLHFGHDASITIVQDGKVLICLEVERIRRVKHAIGIKPEEILLALQDVNLTIADIDYATLTSTQLVEYIFFDSQKLSINLERHPKHSLPCTLTDKIKIDAESFDAKKRGWLEYVFENMPEHPYHRLLPDGKNIVKNKQNLFGGFENFIYANIWNKSQKLTDIAKTDYSNFINNDDVSNGFHYPATLNLFGTKIPAYIFSHHYSHIAYAFYQSDFSEAALISNDGAGGGDLGYGCGFFAYGKNNRIYPLTPNTLTAGEIYDTSAAFIGFKDSGGAGKLMGLSAYGKPRFFDHSFVGNWHDNNQASIKEWTDHCLQRAKELNYDLEPLADPNRILAEINVDFAASTQKLVEEIMIKSALSFSNSLRKSNIFSQNLCLSGGVALNCPANTRVSNETPFKNTFVPPAVGDMGLSIGSALALYYNVLNNERKITKLSPKIAYLGLNKSGSDVEIEKYLNEYASLINFEKSKNIPELAAKDLFENKIIALFYQRSEVGPRALGHRSILANPNFKENWQKVNLIKTRELWRPFAPMVLEGMENQYFSQCQFPAYFMLLNALVKSEKIPAVTHFDQSSRIQSVNADCGIAFNILQEFYKMSGMAVLMNTSFNGPKEPVIESAKEALDFLLSSNLNSLYFANYKVTKK